MLRIPLDTKKLVGMDEIRASKLISAAGGQVNILVRDNNQIAVNTDLRMDRVNLEIRRGVVARAYIG